MARPQRDIVEYFPHDSRASEGDTLTILESRFGNNGYAFWFKLLEKLASTEGHFLDCNDNVRWQLLCARTHSTPENAITIVETLAEVNAIDPELWQSRLIWCQHLVDNIADVYKNRRREKPFKPITTKNNGISTIVSPPLKESETELDINNSSPPPPVPPTTRTPQSKVNKSKYNSLFTLPEYIDSDIWESFLEMRKKQKACPTERAKELLIKDLSKLRDSGNDPNEVLNQSIKNGWKGLFALRNNGNRLVAPSGKYPDTGIKDKAIIE